MFLGGGNFKPAVGKLPVFVNDCGNNAAFPTGTGDYQIEFAVKIIKLSVGFSREVIYSKPPKDSLYPR